MIFEAELQLLKLNGVKFDSPGGLKEISDQCGETVSLIGAAEKWGFFIYSNHFNVIETRSYLKVVKTSWKVVKTSWKDSNST